MEQCAHDAASMQEYNPHIDVKTALEKGTTNLINCDKKDAEAVDAKIRELYGLGLDDIRWAEAILKEQVEHGRINSAEAQAIFAEQVAAGETNHTESMTQQQKAQVIGAFRSQIATIQQEYAVKIGALNSGSASEDFEKQVAIWSLNNQISTVQYHLKRTKRPSEITDFKQEIAALEAKRTALQTSSANSEDEKNRLIAERDVKVGNIQLQIDALNN